MLVNHIRHLHLHRSSIASSTPQKLASVRIGSFHHFSKDVARVPVIRDVEIECAFKDVMATSQDDLPPAVVHDVKKALSKSIYDKTSQGTLANVLRAVEAVEEFTGILTSLKMAIGDSIGLSGEDVKPMPEEFVKALETIYNRFEAYLEALGPEEIYLKKKVENELSTKMIHLKMRCSGLNKEWGKVTVLGTSGLAESYVEQRA
ncbi:OLC1v1013123C1 [Oldenlandia corymbosa var. corymbosa]|uniref:OLC1v1013123C1 n=1 Tax=Oldenlandia corymbosa var. corymbosa TaxID=529605 RepID=A0AAV1DXN7_OLDCO|nr:OLC1v1013123C1 [Oldenlandia corymbosa var. corymbosa]